MGADQQAMLMAVAAAGGSTDPNFASVNQLCHFDGSNGSTTYTNSCPRGDTMTNNSGSPSLTTSNPLFGTASLNIANQNIRGGSLSDYGFGTGDFTVEFAFRTGTPSQSNKDLCNLNSGSGGGDWDVYITSSQFRFYNGADRITGGTVLTNTWQRIAVARISGVTRMFIEGVQVGSDYTDSTSYGNAGQSFIYLGGYHDGTGANCTGQFDEFRLTKGVGRYSSNYTPDVAAFPDS